MSFFTSRTLVKLGVAGSTVALLPKKLILRADAPEGKQAEYSIPAKKSIYDDDVPEAPAASNAMPSSTPSPEPDSSSTLAAIKETIQPERKQHPRFPTPTDRLAVQIRKTRLFLHAHVASAEDSLNSFMNSVFRLEQDFTSTVASLAPPRETGEKLVPGALYVLVAGMSGSIIARNRNIVLRGLTPAVLGLGAAWVVVPHTMTNVSNLAWKYESRFPALADAHLRTRKSILEAIEMAKSGTKYARQAMETKVGEGRLAIEKMVREGGSK